MSIHGTLEVIAGPMFSGKTELLIQRINTAIANNKTVHVFTHATDTRYGDKQIISHSRHALSATAVTTAGEIVQLADPNAIIIAIDEAQFFGPDLHTAVHLLLERGYDVVLSALALTRQGTSFSPIPELLAEAELVTRLTSVCARCGGVAVFHRHIVPEKQMGDAVSLDPSLVGSSESYQALCRSCFHIEK